MIDDEEEFCRRFARRVYRNKFVACLKRAEQWRALAAMWRLRGNQEMEAMLVRWADLELCDAIGWASR